MVCRGFSAQREPRRPSARARPGSLQASQPPLARNVTLAINYYDLGGDKKLNEVIFAGSHDAGITQGAANVQTQSLNILEQARAGVRIFDLRIAGAGGGKVDGKKTVELRAFHADKKVMSNSKTHRVVDGEEKDVTRTKFRLGLGDYGETLNKILVDAKAFVTHPKHSTEFLILKFDKSTNWSIIADACVDLLNPVMYTGGGNVNTKTLDQLRGKVVVLFTEDGFKSLAPGTARGILPIKNLQAGGAYSAIYSGLQYYGKGGTDPFKFWSDKLQENFKKQKKLMTAGGSGNPEVMGMLYWTTTGLKESIRTRNDGMWSQPNIAKMQELWDVGLRDAIVNAAPRNLNLGNPAAGNMIKTFMPNFVMIDFADAQKCQVIYDLNTTAATIFALIQGAPPKARELMGIG
jgi:hypothetical protein